MKLNFEIERGDWYFNKTLCQNQNQDKEQEITPVLLICTNSIIEASVIDFTLVFFLYKKLYIE